MELLNNMLKLLTMNVMGVKGMNMVLDGEMLSLVIISGLLNPLNPQNLQNPQNLLNPQNLQNQNLNPQNQKAPLNQKAPQHQKELVGLAAMLMMAAEI
jgi:hypothetical protein